VLKRDVKLQLTTAVIWRRCVPQLPVEEDIDLDDVFLDDEEVKKTEL